MKRIPSIKSVMTPFPYYIGKTGRLDEAREMMTRHDIKHLPVMDGNRLSSIITWREVDLSLEVDAQGSSPKVRRVGNLPLRDAYVVELSEPLDVVLLHMAREHLDCALVVKENRLAGIFTTTDACRCYGELLQEIFPRGGGDEAA